MESEQTKTESEPVQKEEPQKKEKKEGEAKPKKQKEGKKGDNKGRHRPHQKGGNRHRPAYLQQYPYKTNYGNPYLQQQVIYRTEMYISSVYRHLLDLNARNKDLPKSLDANSKYYMIKSFSEEDVHKSIKYGVWSSSKNGNVILNEAFNITKEKNGYVYLYFSCNGSGRFSGIARMRSPVDESRNFEFWTQDNKWTGLFDVEWIFIKDVPFREFKDMTITMKDGEVKPISNSRDTQEIPFEQAKIIMEKIECFQNMNSILEHFEFYDLRQDNYVKNLQAKKNRGHFKNQQKVEKEEQKK